MAFVDEDERPPSGWTYQETCLWLSSHNISDSLQEKIEEHYYPGYFIDNSSSSIHNDLQLSSDSKDLTSAIKQMKAMEEEYDSLHSIDYDSDDLWNQRSISGGEYLHSKRYREIGLGYGMAKKWEDAEDQSEMFKYNFRDVRESNPNYDSYDHPSQCSSVAWFLDLKEGQAKVGEAEHGYGDDADISFDPNELAAVFQEHQHENYNKIRRQQMKDCDNYHQPRYTMKQLSNNPFPVVLSETGKAGRRVDGVYNHNNRMDWILFDKMHDCTKLLLEVTFMGCTQCGQHGVWECTLQKEIASKQGRKSGGTQYTGRLRLFVYVYQKCNCHGEDIYNQHYYHFYAETKKQEELRKRGLFEYHDNHIFYGEEADRQKDIAGHNAFKSEYAKRCNEYTVKEHAKRCNEYKERTEREAKRQKIVAASATSTSSTSSTSSKSSTSSTSLALQTSTPEELGKEENLRCFTVCAVRHTDCEYIVKARSAEEAKEMVLSQEIDSGDGNGGFVEYEAGGECYTIDDVKPNN